MLHLDAEKDLPPSPAKAKKPKPKSRRRYRFEGHSDPKNGMSVLKMSCRSVAIGGEIEMPNDVHKRHVAMGYQFTRVA